MKGHRWLALLFMLAGTAYAEWQPDPNAEGQLAASALLDEFMTVGGDEFTALFDEAHAFAVFPRLVRNGLMFGWASGKGILVEDDTVTGHLRQRRFSLGIQFGRQTQGQVILFRDATAVELFKASGLEFTPQASVHATKPRRAKDGSFRPSVAVFSLGKKGLMVEAAIGATAFQFEPLP
jgi:lipid-binding SYLF domain-containing protein